MNLEDSESDQEACVEEGQLVVEDDDISEGEDNQVNSDAESNLLTDGRVRLKRYLTFEISSHVTARDKGNLGSLQLE